VEAEPALALQTNDNTDDLIVGAIDCVPSAWVSAPQSERSTTTQSRKGCSVRSA
jgi:hypothetical protein